MSNGSDKEKTSSYNAPSRTTSTIWSSRTQVTSPPSANTYSDSATGIVLNGNYTETRGKRTLGWTDSKNRGPYTLEYRYTGNTSVNQQTFRAGTTFGKEWSFSGMIPGKNYWIEVRDSQGKSKGTTLKGGSVSNFSDGKLKASSIKIEASPRYKSSSSIANKNATAINRLRSSDILKGINRAKYGWKVTVSYPQLAQARHYNMLVAIYSPNGFAYTYFTENYEFTRYNNSGGSFAWELLGDDFFESLYNNTRTIPSGSYKMELYLDGMFVKSLTLNVD